MFSAAAENMLAAARLALKSSEQSLEAFVAGQDMGSIGVAHDPQDS